MALKLCFSYELKQVQFRAYGEFSHENGPPT